MIERPILFNTEMAQAVLAGRKTQTRRVVKPQIPVEFCNPHNLGNGNFLFQYSMAKDHTEGMTKTAVCPYGVPGDRLWVRETWRPWHVNDSECGCGDWCDCSRIPPTPVCYRASSDELEDEDRECGIKWMPSIHMFRKDSRILLEVVSVRVERVQEISEEDAKAEGCERGLAPEDINDYSDPLTGYYPPTQYYDGFHWLWDSINAKRGFGWDVNPWVWVVEFKRIDG